MISVIIPVINEAEGIASLIEYVKKTAVHDTELIIVDGGSIDQTKEIAINKGAVVIDAPKGRAKQMNAGVNSATGEVLYFLHADTYPPKTWQADIQEAIKQGYDAGCCRLSFDDHHPALKFYAWFTKLILTSSGLAIKACLYVKVCLRKPVVLTKNLWLWKIRNLLRR